MKYLGWAQTTNFPKERLRKLVPARWVQTPFLAQFRNKLTPVAASFWGAFERLLKSNKMANNPPRHYVQLKDAPQVSASAQRRAVLPGFHEPEGESL
jgi:hypothetical protein